PLMPIPIVKAGLRNLPKHLDITPNELNTTEVVKREPFAALFIAGGDDHIVPPYDVERLSSMAGAGSKLIVVPNASHEAVTYYFDQLTEPVLDWLGSQSRDPK